MPVPRALWIAPLIVAGLVALAAPQSARACSCVPPDLVFTYNNSSDVFSGEVLAQAGGDSLGLGMIEYTFRVDRSFNGCTRAGQIVTLTTPGSSAACGLLLSVGERYLITAGAATDPGTFSVVSCGYNRRLADLSDADLAFLNSRFACCGDDCACVSGDEVQCFADPCQVTPPCPDGTCTANYCGGCFAEFYNEIGQAVCTACETGADCSFGQVCSREGQCRTAGGDRDGDGVPDDRDNCKYWPNGDQRDVDGNGHGDACECGDQTGDGVVDVMDIIDINRSLFGMVEASPLCDTNDDAVCNVGDMLGVNAKLFGAEAYCGRYPSHQD